MTTPVYMHNTPQGQSMEFVLPARFKEDAPQPRGQGLRSIVPRQVTLQPFALAVMPMPAKLKTIPKSPQRIKSSREKGSRLPCVIVL